MSCPICADPTGDDVALCPSCGWQLRAGPFLGRADEAQLAAFAEKLERAAAEHDLAAAVRCGATRVEAVMLRLRGGEPSEAAWAAARTVAGNGTTAQAANGALLGVLTRLTDRTIPVVHFVGMSHAHISLQRVVADPIGFPRLDGAAATLDWATATVSADPLRRRFQLAGGVGAKPVDRQDFDRAVEHALPRLDDGACVLVGPPPGWSLLDRAQDVLRRSGRVEATVPAGPAPFDLRKIVMDALRAAPLPCDYDVLLQRVDPATGAVELVTRRLFAAGTRVDPKSSPPAQRLAVHGSPVGNTAAVIPVVARSGPDPACWRVLALGRTALPARSTAQVEFVLDGLEQVRVSRKDGAAVAPPGVTPLSELLATVPDRVALPPPLDLVCAVELCGGTDDVRKRLAFAEQLVDLVAARHSRPTQVRFGVLGYLDHHDRPTPLYRSNPVVVGGEALGPAAGFRSVLGMLYPHVPLRDSATAMEDVLAKAAGMHWHRSPTADRVLVLVGRRPPSVPTGSGPIATCPHRMDWRDSVRRLRERWVRIIGVREPGPVTTVGGADGDAIRAYATRTWQELAGPDLFVLGPDAFESVSTTVTQRSDIPPDAFPLGLATPVGAPHRPRKASP